MNFQPNVGIIMLLCIVVQALAFSGLVDKQQLQLQLARLRTLSKPLSTAGSLIPSTSNGLPGDSIDSIPRLEPGLRYLTPRIQFLNRPIANVKIAKFSLDWLNQHDPLLHRRIDRSRGGFPIIDKLFKPFERASQQVAMFAARFMKQLRKIATTGLIVATTTFSAVQSQSHTMLNANPTVKVASSLSAASAAIVVSMSNVQSVDAATGLGGKQGKKGHGEKNVDLFVCVEFWLHEYVFIYITCDLNLIYWSIFLSSQVPPLHHK